MPEEPILGVLLLSTAAVLASLLGVLPFERRTKLPARWTGWANAIASGLMLGGSYVLVARGIEKSGWATVLGAGLGVSYVVWTHWYTGAEAVDTGPGKKREARHSDRLLLLNALHASAEGFAIGMAALSSQRTGIFLAVTLGVHNVAEAMVLTELLQLSGVPHRRAYSLSVLTRVPQVLVAVAGFAVMGAIDGSLPWGLGFAAGALLYLVLTELLPAAYQRSGQNTPAALVTLLAGAVLLAQALVW